MTECGVTTKANYRKQIANRSRTDHEQIANDLWFDLCHVLSTVNQIVRLLHRVSVFTMEVNLGLRSLCTSGPWYGFQNIDIIFRSSYSRLRRHRAAYSSATSTPLCQQAKCSSISSICITWSQNLQSLKICQKMLLGSPCDVDKRIKFENPAMSLQLQSWIPQKWLTFPVDGCLSDGESMGMKISRSVKGEAIRVC